MDDPEKHSMYYIAIVCPAGIAGSVLKYKQWMKEHFGCTVALKSPAHVTLIPPFWLEEKKEQELKQMLQSFTSPINGLLVRLQGFDHFSNRVLFIRIEDNDNLYEIKKQVDLHFIQFPGNSIKTDDRPFHPHITIANRDLKPGDFIKAWTHFSKLECNESFTATTVSLLRLSGSGIWTVIEEKNW